MSIAFSPTILGVIIVVALLSGAVNGVAGFGFAVVATMALASVIDPATAVVLMILPILGVNLSLVSGLSGQDLRTCGRRFAPLVVAATVGTVVGMAVLDVLPEAPLRVGLGVVSLAFVATTQQLFSLPGLGGAKERCFVETPLAMAGVGAVSGVLFGATNVGVQLVAYVRSCDLSHGLFVGVIALVFVGINGLRVGAAAALGLYPDATVVAVSVAAVVPAVLGVEIGKRIQVHVGDRFRQGAVLGLLTVIGVRLIAGGLGVF